MNTKKTKRNRIGPIGTAILTTLALGGVVTVVALFPGVAYIIAPFLKKKKYSPKQAISNNIESLIKCGLVVRSKDGTTLTLTSKGRFQAFLRHGLYVDRKSKKWDAVWRVVVFDVPNSKGKIRFELRRAMQLYGFKLLQKSVWVYPYECDDFVALLKSQLGISQDVLYMKVSSIENQKFLEKEFKL